MTFLCRTVFSGGHFLTAALIFGQDTEAVSHADIIANLPQILQGVGILPKLHTGFKVHGVDDEVGVDVFGIAMGGDENFRAGPGTHRELFCHLVCLPGCDILCWREGLNILVEFDAVQLAVGGLGGFELQNGIQSITVNAADQSALGLFIPGLVLPHTVIHHGAHSTEVLLGFPDIGYGCNTASPPRLMR